MRPLKQTRASEHNTRPLAHQRSQTFHACANAQTCEESDAEVLAGVGLRLEDRISPRAEGLYSGVAAMRRPLLDDALRWRAQTARAFARGTDCVCEQSGCAFVHMLPTDALCSGRSCPRVRAMKHASPRTRGFSQIAFAAAAKSRARPELEFRFSPKRISLCFCGTFIVQVRR